MSAALIEQVMASPLLPEMVQATQAKMVSEQKLRLKFITTLPPSRSGSSSMAK
jgi:hypothetical protein